MNARMVHSVVAKMKRIPTRTLVLFALLLVAFLLALSFVSTSSSGFRSVELKFTDASRSGALIVPASCPSYAHYSGECNVPPAPNPATNCGIAISPNSISSGGSATLGWSANTSFGLFTLTSEGSINNGVGAVAVTGTLNVSPTVSTVYTYSGTQYFLAVPIRTFSCSAAITVAGQPPQEEGGSCSAGYYCNGSDLYYRNDTCTSTQFIQNCPNGCSSSACLNPPPPNALIRVVPGLVQAGETTQVEWSAANVLAPSCSVVGSNGDQWDDSATGNQTSSPIFTQTTYTLSCTGTNGAAVTETATVNILPIFEET
jgi:hypothetical protein